MPCPKHLFGGLFLYEITLRIRAHPTRYKAPLIPNIHPKIHPQSSPETKYEKIPKIYENPNFRIFFVFCFWERIRGVFWGLEGFVSCRGRRNSEKYPCEAKNSFEKCKSRCPLQMGHFQGKFKDLAEETAKARGNKEKRKDMMKK